MNMKQEVYYSQEQVLASVPRSLVSAEDPVTEDLRTAFSLNIRNKILGMVAILVLAITTIVILGWNLLGDVVESTEHIVKEQFVPLINVDIDHLVNDLEASSQDIKSAESAVLLAVIAEKMSLVATEDSVLQAADQANSENLDVAREMMSKASSAFDTEETLKLYADFEFAFDAWSEKTRSVFRLAATPGRHKFAKKVSNGGSAEKRYLSLFEIMSQLSDLQKTRVDEALVQIDAKKVAVSSIADEAISSARNGTTVFITIGVITILVSVGMAFVISGGITRSIRDVVLMLKDVAQGEGDLTQRLDTTSKDELGELALWFNRFVSNVQSIIVDVKNTAESVAIGSIELEKGTESFSSRSHSQASSLEEVAASIEEMSTSVSQNAENAKQAKDIAGVARASADSGSEVTSRAVAAMQEINDASSRIAEITSVIDEMAFQTNLLALNAAVEAARAGDLGRGFAVVAGEVRNLAGRSATAAKEISALIKESVSKVEVGTALVTESGLALENIVDSVKQVDEMIAEIADTSLEQANGLKTVNQSMLHIDEVAQQNTAVIEETAATSEKLTAEANHLRDSMSRFRVA